MRRMLVLVASMALPLVNVATCHAQDGTASVASDAWTCLAKASMVTTTGGIGRNGQPSKESKAFAVLYGSATPGDAFASLYDKAEGSTGKFWALLGLRFLEDPREERLRKDFLGADRGKIMFARAGVGIDDWDARESLPGWLNYVDTGSIDDLIGGVAKVLSDPEKARKRLEKASSVTTEDGVGRGNLRSWESIAFATLYHSKNPGDAFAALYRSAAGATGKFWALLGLHFLKDSREKELEKDFLAQKPSKITFAEGGCCVDEGDPRVELPKWLARIDHGELKGLLVAAR